MIRGKRERGAAIRSTSLHWAARGRLSALIVVAASVVALVSAAPLGAATREGQKLAAQRTTSQRPAPPQPHSTPAQPGPPAPAKDRGRSTLAFLALLFGYAVVVAVPLVLGGIAALPRLRRMRRRRVYARSKRESFVQRLLWAVRARGRMLARSASPLRRHLTLRPFHALVSAIPRRGPAPMQAVVRQTEPLSLPTEASVSDVDRTNVVELPREGAIGVGDQVGAILAAAEEDAERMRREVHEEAAAMRRQSESALAAGTADLAREIERIKAEAVADARSLREEAEREAAERLRSASEEAAKRLARADAKAEARRASAAETARIVDEAAKRHAALRESTETLEDRLRMGVEVGLRAAQEGLQQLSSGLEELLGQHASEDEVEDPKPARQKTG